MRRALLAFLLVCALGVGGAAAAFTSLDRDSDQVIVTEEVLFGDKAHARGLTIRSEAQMFNRILWNTDYTIGEQPETVTEYTFSPRRVEHFWVSDPGGLWMNSMWMDPERAQDPGLTAMYEELIEAALEVPLGEEVSKVYRVADYLDYYPLEFNVDLPDYYMSEHQIRNLQERLSDQGLITDREQNYLELYAALREYIRISVLPEERREMHVVLRDTDGTRSSYGSGTTDTDFYPEWVSNALTEDTLYFIVQNRSRDGKVMDFSHVPGGYGIHQLKFDRAEGKETLADPDSLSLVYPLDEEGELIWLDTSTDQERLLLLTVEEGDCVFRVIRCADMATIQEQVLYRVTEERSPSVADCRDNYVLMRTSDRGILLLEEGENGTFDLKLDIPVEEEEQIGHGFSYSHWNGEKLVLVDTTGDYHEDPTGVCGYLAAVYDATGPLYGGKYSTSLNTGFYNEYDSNACIIWDHEGIKISWK